MSKGVAYVKSFDKSKRPSWEAKSPPRYITTAHYRSRQTEGKRVEEDGGVWLGSQAQAKRILRQTHRHTHKKVRASELRGDGLRYVLIYT